MKQLIILIHLALSLPLFTACHTNEIKTPPSKNEALNTISNSNASTERGSLQNILDNWLTNEWTPAVESDKEIQEKYLNKKEEESHFTLQEYMDKREAYLKVHPSDHNNSHVHKVESLPVIGSTKRR